MISVARHSPFGFRPKSLVKAILKKARFIPRTLDTVTKGSLYQVLGSFFYGREHIIPRMFEGLLREWRIDEDQAPMFVYYLKRHIELDGDSHGPAAKAIIKQVTEDKPNALRQLYLAALDAMNDRIELWDGLNLAMSQDRPAYSSGRIGSLGCAPEQSLPYISHG